MRQCKQRRTSPTSAFGAMPRFFPEFLAQHCETFAALSNEHRPRVAMLLWTAGLNRNHRTVENASTIHYNGHEALFGRGGAFHRINKALGGWFVQVAPPDFVLGDAAAWQPSNEAQSLLDSYLDRVYASDEAKAGAGIIDCNGKTFRIQKCGIQSLMNNGSTKTRYVRDVIRGATEVDSRNLQEFILAAKLYMFDQPAPEGFQYAYDKWDSIKYGKGPNSGAGKAYERAEEAKEQARAIADLSYASNVPGFVIPSSYAEVQSGRLYASGTPNLQNVRGEVRRAALKGSYDIDLESAHYAILGQLAQRLGKPVPNIDYYTEHKDFTRERVAFETGVSIDDAKFILLGLLFGAGIKENDGALGEKLGSATMHKLRRSETIKGILRDLRRSRSAIIKHYRDKSKWNSQITNDAGRNIDANESPRHILSHLLQGAESRCLEAMMSVTPGQVKVAAHDGYVLASKPDLALLKQAIREATGYDLELSVKLL